MKNILWNKSTVLKYAAVFVMAAGTYGWSRDDQSAGTTDTSKADQSSQTRGSVVADQMDVEVLSLIRSYQRSLNEGDVDLVRSVYADDAVFIGQPFPTATGIEKIAALYAGFFSQVDFDIKFDVLEVDLSGDLGFVRTRSHGTIAPKGQEPEGTEGNREIFILKKIDGEWKIYRYIFNAEVG